MAAVDPCVIAHGDFPGTRGTAGRLPEGMVIQGKMNAKMRTLMTEGYTFTAQVCSVKVAKSHYSPPEVIIPTDPSSSPNSPSITHTIMCGDTSELLEAQW